ncbi:MAG TPA: SDR family oxidoreductase [Actinoplanes sp.]|jgi:uncharacterized protein YbjT (DUF2867 family)
MSLIVVTGSTGQLGGRVARRLAAAGVAQRLLVRDPARAPRLEGATVVQADYGDRGSLHEALSDAEIVLMVSAEESPDRVDVHCRFIDAAADAGVGHLVYTSFHGAGPDATFTLARDHWATEEYIRDSGLTATILRDNLYADFLPLMVGDDGVIRGPAGDGRVSAVARDDVADVAAAVLRSPDDHAGSTYDLTGPQALSLAEVAATITEVTGRHVTFVNETLAEAYASRARFGAPAWQVDAWVSTYTGIAAGEMQMVSADVERVTGHPATSLESILRA